MKASDNRKTTILEENGVKYTWGSDLANKFAKKLSEISNPQSYDTEFQRRKRQEEHGKLNFNSDNNESYNKAFAIEELIDAIRKTKCSTPGPAKFITSCWKRGFYVK